MEQVFEILNLVVPSLILSLFALNYQLRKKVEIRIETQLAKQRIQAYESVHSTFCQLMSTQSPAIQLQSEIDEIKNYYGFRDVRFEYSVVLASETDFDNFFHQAQQVVTDNSILFDYDTLLQAKKSMGILSQIKSYLDAFCDASRMCFPEESVSNNVQKKIDKAYLLASIMLQNEFNRSFLELEDVISHQISNIEVVPSKCYFKRIRHWFSDNMMFLVFCGARLRFNILANFFSRLTWTMLGRSRRIFTFQMERFTYILEYIFVSDRYTFQQFLHLDQCKYEELHRDFWGRMSMQLHTMWTN